MHKQTLRDSATLCSGVPRRARFQFANLSDADVQVMPISLGAKDNKYIDDVANCSNCVLRSITASQGFDVDEPGDAVCNHGAFSGTKCGSLQNRNFTFSWEEMGVVLLRQRRATYARQPGDSGGPVTAAANVAAGSHTHFEPIQGVNYAVYSHIFEMEQATGWTVYKGG